MRALIAGIDGARWVAGPTAAALHGFDGFALRPPFHLVVLRGRYLNRIGHVIHTTCELPLLDRALLDDVPLTSPSRTVIDLAASCDAKLLTIAVDSALRDGGTTEEFLHRRLVGLRSKGRYGLPALLEVIAGREITRGGHSWLERAFLEWTAAAGLPRPQMQQVLTKRGERLIRVDCLFPGTPVVVELLGYRFHRTRNQLQSDAERMNRLALDGYLVLQATYVDVVERSPVVLAAILEALARLGSTPSRSVSAHRTNVVSVR